MFGPPGLRLILSSSLLAAEAIVGIKKRDINKDVETSDLKLRDILTSFVNSSIFLPHFKKKFNLKNSTQKLLDG
jgi:hypothetical protein